MSLTQETIDNATKSKQYIVVSPMEVSKIIITDIFAVWAVYPEVVLAPAYSAVGYEKDILKALGGDDLTEEQVEIVVEGLISKENYEDNPDEIDDLIADYNSWRDELLKVNNSKVTLMDLLTTLNPNVRKEVKPVSRVATRATPSKTSTTSKSSTSAKSPTGKGSPGRKSKSLQQKVDEINKINDSGEALKIINVSNWISKGTTTTTNRAAAPRLHVSPNLPFMSNNAEALVAAIEDLGGNDEDSEYYDDYLDALNYQNGDKTAKSKTTTSKAGTKTTTKVPPKPFPVSNKKVHVVPTEVPEAKVPVSGTRTTVRAGLIPPKLTDVKPLVSGIKKEEKVEEVTEEGEEGEVTEEEYEAYEDEDEQ